MSLELIMNANGEIDHAPGSQVSGGAFIITSTPDPFSKAEGAGVHVGPLGFSFSGGSAAGMESGSVNIPAAVIPATAIFDKASNSLVMRLGDSAVIIFNGTLAPSGNPGTVAGTVEVSDAGQTTGRGQ
jgi:hypothetical protein